MAHPRRVNRGIVLLTTLLILAVLIAIGWQMAGRQSIFITQHRLAFAGDQALFYALGAETLARQMLHQDWSEGGPQKDTLLEIWAQTAPPFTIENGAIEIRARDLNSCFNLNSVADGPGGPGGAGTGQEAAESAPPTSLFEPDTGNDTAEIGGSAASGSDGQGRQNDGVLRLQRLRQLLQQLGLPEEIADAWRDWVDLDEEVSGAGAEDGDYMLLEPGYRTANQPAAHVSELRLIRDMPAEAVDALDGLVCTLPNTGLKLNVNTARPEVLAALNPSVSIEGLRALAEGPRDFSDVGQFTQMFPELGNAVDALSVTSEYFEVSIRARVDDSAVQLVSVLRRDPASGQIELISRDLSRNYQSMFAAAPNPPPESRQAP
ncbi:MAG: type II secretion system minor pseudopilin GspK [Gammaproteobacteria bacterium]